VEVVASLSQILRAAAQCGLFTHKAVPVIFEPPCNLYKGDNLIIIIIIIKAHLLQSSSVRRAQ